MKGKVTLEDSTIWDSSTRSRHSETPSIEGSAGHAPNATLLRCIVRSIRLSSQSDLAVKDSIIDGGQGRAIGPIAGEEYGPSVKIDSGTILGETAVQAIEATDSIFDGNVTVARMQIGYLRYCYAPDGSKTPRRFHCQPDLTTEGANETERRQIRIWLKPSFTSRIVGAPGYAQLRQNCPVQIKTGAEIGSEMGVFGMLHQPKRAARIKTALDEYMYYGLNPGVFYVDHYMPHTYETDPARISNRPDQD
ncbi:MAG: hypothetical protein IIB17_11605 [Chloroflexi bacterium]|nr:hypothetical protein [Chloroflexota bacterium]